MRGLVVALPQPPEGRLAAYIPELEVHVRQIDGGDILADGWDGVACCCAWLIGSSTSIGGGIGGLVEGLDLVEEGFVRPIFEGEKGGMVRDSRVLPVSALRGSGVKEAVEWVRSRVVWNKEGRAPVMR